MKFIKFLPKLIKFLIIYLLSLSFCEAKTIKIGLASNFSAIAENSYNPYGLPLKNATQMAVDELNKKLKNIKIELYSGPRKLDS